ncbi:hypothetical protein MKW92_036328 [Papaver armeniacum]|nr:hypothetical protein MKW92_036328 [Papaver armeniacum]
MAVREQVSVTFEDEGGAQSKRIGIKLMDSLYQTGLSSKWCHRNHPSNALVLSVPVKWSVKD